MARLKRFGVSIPADLVDTFDRLIEGKGYRTRSEAIRDLMRDALVESEWESNAGEVVGTVTIVYNHEVREISRVLTQLQHQYLDAIVCTTHVHYGCSTTAWRCWWCAALPLRCKPSRTNSSAREVSNMANWYVRPPAGRSCKRVRDTHNHLPKQPETDWTGVHHVHR
jgi:nickel-responsive transcriptional regulator NikR